MISSAVWIGADSETALSVSNGCLNPIETDKAVSLSDTFHTSAYHTARAALRNSPFFSLQEHQPVLRLQQILILRLMERSVGKFRQLRINGHPAEHRNIQFL